jgi:hypothetical protein
MLSLFCPVIFRCLFPSCVFQCEIGRSVGLLSDADVAEGHRTLRHSSATQSADFRPENDLNRFFDAIFDAILRCFSRVGLCSGAAQGQAP